jgi:hypothetical protein
MFGPGKMFLEKDLQDWHVDCWSWLMRWGGGAQRLRSTDLVLPNRTFFPPTEAEGHARAVHVFNTVKRLAGMETWPAKLEAQRELAGRLGPLAHVQNGRTAAGTFSQHGNSALVTYDPAQIKQPIVLVATFAHELGHYLTENFPVLLAPPDRMEPATDVATIFLGFGVFGANSASNFSQFAGTESQGWSMQRLGYLTDAEWSFGLAMFGALSGRGIEEMKDHLKSSLWGEVKRAAKIIERDGLAEKARAQSVARSKH